MFFGDRAAMFFGLSAAIFVADSPVMSSADTPAAPTVVLRTAFSPTSFFQAPCRLPWRAIRFRTAAESKRLNHKTLLFKESFFYSHYWNSTADAVLKGKPNGLCCIFCFIGVTRHNKGRNK